MNFFRKVGTLARWVFDEEKSVLDFRKRAVWKPEQLVEESQVNITPEPTAITAHIFYEDFAHDFIALVGTLGKISKVYVTTSSTGIKDYLEKNLAKANLAFEVRLTPNIGRNFGPLLVEFSKDLLNEKSFVHVHSKKSLHSADFATEWLSRNVNLLLSKEGLKRISHLVQSNERIGMVYVDASDLLFGVNFRWGRSLPVAKSIFWTSPGFESVKWAGRLSFPAGGMFWVKSEAIRPLLEMDWNYSMFPSEKGQGDGALQHAIERIVGLLVISRGFRQAVHVKNINRFKIV